MKRGIYMHVWVRRRSGEPWELGCISDPGEDAELIASALVNQAEWGQALVSVRTEPPPVDWVPDFISRPYWPVTTIQEFRDKYGIEGVSLIVGAFIERAPDFKGGNALAATLGEMMADLESALEAL